MSDKEKEEKWRQELHNSYQNSEKLIHFLMTTLESFAHRYFNNPTIESQKNQIILEGFEDNLGMALKISDPLVKEAVKKLAKSVPREQGPKIVSRLIIDIKQLEADQGEIWIKSEINWSHPDYLSTTTDKKELQEKLKWSDLQVFRKGFPLSLERLCDLFL